MQHIRCIGYIREERLGQRVPSPYILFPQELQDYAEQVTPCFEWESIRFFFSLVTNEQFCLLTKYCQS